MVDDTRLAGKHWVDTPELRRGEDDSDRAVAFDAALRRTSQGCDNLLYKKHQDYGPYGITNAPGGAINGLVVRLHDKVARLANLVHGGGEVNYESLEDTLRDIRNYGQIGVMVLEGTWPGVQEGP